MSNRCSAEVKVASKSCGELNSHISLAVFKAFSNHKSFSKININCTQLLTSEMHRHLQVIRGKHENILLCTVCIVCTPGRVLTFNQMRACSRYPNPYIYNIYT